MWSVKVNGVLKIKSKTKNNTQGNLWSLIHSLRKLQKDEVWQRMSSVCAKYTSPEMILTEDLVLRYPWNTATGILMAQSKRNQCLPCEERKTVDNQECLVHVRPLQIQTWWCLGFQSLLLSYSYWQTQNVVPCGLLGGTLCYEHCWDLPLIFLALSVVPFNERE